MTGACSTHRDNETGIVSFRRGRPEGGATS
jgi:hypothetical protein